VSRARGGWLVVFAKDPRPGFAKTRLCPPLSPGEAAELYRCLLADALAESGRAASLLGLEVMMAVDPPEAALELARSAGAGLRAIAQRGGSLGARMTHVARQAAAAGASCVLLRGSDSPALSCQGLAEARRALAGCDVVLRPDRDGGYSLVGLGATALLRGLGRPGLFDHPMSTPSTLADTRAAAERLGLAVTCLDPGFDVDRFEDLRWLAEARHQIESLPCPRTLAFLDERALWPEPRGVTAR